MRYYVNQSTGLAVVTGKIKSISDDRMVMVVTSEQYDRTAGKNAEIEINASAGIPYDDSFKVGFGVTAAGYQRGKGTIIVESASVGNNAYETQDLAVITGFVTFAGLNEEKNADGSQKMKADGVTPRKPHFDVTIRVMEDGKAVNHVIKVYENPNEPAGKGQFDRVQKLFKNFDRESNRIKATFVTQPGQAYSSKKVKDGQEYVNNFSSHIGYKSMDIEFLDQKEKGKEDVAKEAPAQAAPVQEAPKSGFDAPPTLEDGDDYFR